VTAIAIDAGTSAIKVVGYGDDGTELLVGRRPTRVLRPRPGWAEQDMAEVWAVVCDAVREVLVGLPAAPDVVAVTAQGDGAWLVDEKGHPTGPALLWNDGRAASHVTAWERDGVVEEAFHICGSRLATGLPNALLAWLRDNEPHRTAESSHLLTCGGWLYLRLTGERVVDESDASAPFLDIRRRSWSDRLFELFGLEWARELLPDLRGDDSRVSSITTQGAEETGLPAGIPVVLAPYDICATAIGTGAVAPGQACCILGTTLATEVVADTVVTEEPVGITVTLGVPGRYLRAFPTMSGGDVLAWGARMLGLPSVTELMVLAARGAPGTAGVRFLPYLSPAGERAPFFDPNARGSLSGLSLDARPQDVARALLEGLTMTIRECLGSAPTSPAQLALCGGGTRSDHWMRMIADVTGLAVTIPADSEVGARGAWLTAMVATARESDFDTAAAAHVRVAATHAPDPEAFHAFTDQYADQLRLRELTEPTWTAGRGRAASVSEVLG
jgi:erythritol kinase